LSFRSAACLLFAACLSFRSAAEESAVVFASASASAVAFLFSCHPSPQAEDLLLSLPSPLLLLLLSPLSLPLPFCLSFPEGNLLLGSTQRA
jgi:hypothetical protein